MPITSRKSGLDERPRIYPPELLPVFDDSFVGSFDLFDEYVARIVLGLFRSTGLNEACRREASAAEAVARLGMREAIALAPVSWILAVLAARGWIEAVAGAPGARRFRTPPAATVLDPGEILERQRAHDPRCLPSYDIVAMAAAHYPAVLRGETTGEQALFGPEGILPWVRYFSGDNPLYAVSNRVGAVAAARAARDQAGPILEIGGGLGSGADALLSQIGHAPVPYHLTEISPLFLKRAQRNLAARHPQAVLRYSELDIDRPFPAAVVEPASHALVYGVNVLHVAHDLAATLAEIRNALRPGGMLVMAECVRPFPGDALPIELVFNLLESFRNPVLVPGWRPNGGFLTPEQWVEALSANGFHDVHIYPDVASIRDDYPSFMIAAIVARRP